MKKILFILLLILPLTACIDRKLASDLIGQDILSAIKGKTNITDPNRSVDKTVFSGIFSRSSIDYDDSKSDYYNNAKSLVSTTISSRKSEITKDTTSFERHNREISSLYVKDKTFVKNTVEVYLATKSDLTSTSYNFDLTYSGAATKKSDKDKKQYDGYFLYNKNKNTEYFAGIYVSDLKDENDVDHGYLRASLYVQNNNSYNLDKLGLKNKDEDEKFKLVLHHTDDSYENYDYSEDQNYIGLSYSGNSYFMAMRGRNKSKAKIYENLNDNISGNDKTEERYKGGSAKLTFKLALTGGTLELTEGEINIKSPNLKLLIKDIHLNQDSSSPFIYGDIYEDEEDDDFVYTRGANHYTGGEFLAYFLTDDNGYYLPTLIGLWSYTRSSCYDLDDPEISSGFGSSCMDNLEKDEELAMFDAYAGVFVASPTSHAYTDRKSVNEKISDKMEDETDFASYFSIVGNDSDNTEFLTSKYTAPATVAEEYKGAKGVANLVYYINNTKALAGDSDLSFGQVQKKHKNTSSNGKNLFTYLKTIKDSYVNVYVPKHSYAKFDAFYDANSIINKKDRETASKAGTSLPEPIYRKEEDYSEGRVFYWTNLFTEVYTSSYYLDLDDQSPGLLLAGLEVNNLRIIEDNKGDDYSAILKYNFPKKNDLQKDLEYIKYTGATYIYATKPIDTDGDNRNNYELMTDGKIELYFSESPDSGVVVGNLASNPSAYGEITFKSKEVNTEKKFIIESLTLNKEEPLRKKLTGVIKPESASGTEDSTGNLLANFVQSSNGFYRPELAGIFNLKRNATVGADPYGGFESFVGTFVLNAEGEYKE